MYIIFQLNINIIELQKNFIGLLHYVNKYNNDLKLIFKPIKLKNKTWIATFKWI